MRNKTILLISWIALTGDIGAATAPSSIEGMVLTSTLQGEVSELAFGTNGAGRKTKSGTTTAFSFSNYSATGNTASFNVVDGGMSGTATLTFSTDSSGTVEQAVPGLGTRSGTFSIRAGLAPVDLVGMAVSSVIDGETSVVGFQAGGSATKTKNGATTSLTWSDYVKFGDVATFTVVDSGITGTTTLTFSTSTSGTILQDIPGVGARSGFFTVGALSAPTLVSSSLTNGVVSFTFSEAMDTNYRSFMVNSPQPPPDGAFTNFRWSPDARTISFDAALSEGLTITFVLNPSGSGFEFRNTAGTFVAANTPTQQFTVNNPPTLVSASLLSGVVTFAFSEPMDQTSPSFAWNSSITVQSNAFSNYSWSGDGTRLSFNADLPPDLTIEFILNPSGQQGSFRDVAGNLLAADTKATSLTTPPNQPPTVILSASTPSVNAGQSVTLTASASDSDGTIAKIEFIDGQTKLGEDTSAPYSLTVSLQTEGPHSLTARAIDNNGAIGISTEQIVFVSSSGTDGTARTNRVLSLDGDGDYVTIPTSAAIQPEQEFTIEAWLYPVHSDNSNAHFFNKGDGLSGGSSRTYELIYKQNGSLQFQVFVGTSTFVVPSVAAVPSEQWIHFAGVFSSAAGQVKVYTNAVLAATSGASIQGLTLRTTSLPLVLGYVPSFNNTFGKGKMDEFRIWNVARSPEQIRSSMRSRLTGQEANLVGYWNFDDGSISDLTGGGLNGTRVGNAAVGEIVGNDFPHAARLVSATPQGGATIDLVFDSETNQTQRIEYSGNLTNWVTLMTVTSTNSPMTVTDVNAPTTNRYYRIVTP